MKRNIKKIAEKAVRRCLGIAGFAVALSASLSGCYDDGVDGGSYYVFVGQTVGDYLDANEQYSEFSTALEKAGMKGLLYAYGEYTCFAPTNEAMDNYINSHFPGSTVEELPDSALEAIAKSHLIGTQYLTSDFSTGYLQQPNMYDRRVQVSISKEYNPALNDSATVYLLNEYSRIIQANDTVSNGVVHTIDHVLEQSSYILPDYMRSRCEELGFTLFMEAMDQTHLSDSILKEEDERPEMASKLAQYASEYSGETQKVPTRRSFGYTVFVEKDEVFSRIYDPQNMGKPVFTGDLESDIQSLANYAKEVYDAVYPEDAGLYDNDFTHPKNPLNRFMAYHILDRNASYSDLVVSTREWSVQEGGNFVEYYETLSGNLMRFEKVSTEGDAIRINRCVDERRPNLRMEGSVVASTGGASTFNGNFQFVSDVLSYNANVVTMLSTERIRLDTGSLLPELTNNNIRFDPDEVFDGWYFPSGYFDDLYYDDQTVCRYTRWPYGQDAGHSSLDNYRTDNMKFGGEYDVTLRLPSVPAGQQYEIRVGYEAQGLMSITQIYFGYGRSNEEMSPTGIPLDMMRRMDDPKVGGMEDWRLGSEDAITENDRAMRNLGYMKGPGAMHRMGADRMSVGNSQRDGLWYLRHIITTRSLDGRPTYLRFRKVDERSGGLLNIDFIEIVPRSVYNGAVPEDRN